MEQNPSTSLFELHIDAPSSAYLSETAKWAKFFAILGFIFCGLIVCAAFFAGSIMSALSGMNRYGTETTGAATAIGGAFLAILYIAIALLYFFPCLFLFRFATKMKAALRTNDQEQLATSFKNLKSCFRFMGILTIIVLSIYVLVLIFAIIGAAAGSR
jgi:hypothetical protein